MPTRTNRFLIIGLAAFFLALAAPVRPAGAEEDVEALKAEIEALKARIEKMEAGREDRMSAAAQVRGPGDPWFAFDSPAADPLGWDPFLEMQRMQERMNRLFRDSLQRSSLAAAPAQSAAVLSVYEPDLDIEEKEDHYLVSLDLPGMEKDKIDINVTDHALTISGERRAETRSEDEDRGFYRMERRYGSFSRRLPLPSDATPKGVTAAYEEGVLRIRIPRIGEKPQDERVTQVEIR